jgi:hypothetical protein
MSLTKPTLYRGDYSHPGHSRVCVNCGKWMRMLYLVTKCRNCGYANHI